ncbi:MAG: hypothetical protein ABI193_08400, partial [Minicystis sp.]
MRCLSLTVLSALSVLMIAAAPALTGCSGTGQPEVAYQAFAAPIAASTITAGDWTVTLDEATLAFGPVYFCASASGSADLCETALGELTEIRAVDLLDPSPQALGEARGFTGTIRSASYDYGIHWFLTEEAPTAAGPAPGGHSARFAGQATKAGSSLRFVADVDVIPQFQGQRAVPSAAASAVIEGSDVRLDVGFD